MPACLFLILKRCRLPSSLVVTAFILCAGLLSQHWMAIQIKEHLYLPSNLARQLHLLQALAQQPHKQTHLVAGEHRYGLPFLLASSHWWLVWEPDWALAAPRQNPLA